MISSNNIVMSSSNSTKTMPYLSDRSKSFSVSRVAPSPMMSSRSMSFTTKSATTMSGKFAKKLGKKIDGKYALITIQEDASKEFDVTVYFLEDRASYRAPSKLKSLSKIHTKVFFANLTYESLTAASVDRLESEKSARSLLIAESRRLSGSVMQLKKDWESMFEVKVREMIKLTRESYGVKNVARTETGKVERGNRLAGAHLEAGDKLSRILGERYGFIVSRGGADYFATMGSDKEAEKEVAVALEDVAPVVIAVEPVIESVEMVVEPESESDRDIAVVAVPIAIEEVAPSESVGESKPSTSELSELPSLQAVEAEKPGKATDSAVGETVEIDGIVYPSVQPGCKCTIM